MPEQSALYALLLSRKHLQRGSDEQGTLRTTRRTSTNINEQVRIALKSQLHSFINNVLTY